MPLVTIGEELKKAQVGHYALPLFDTFESNATDGLFAALEERRAPAMMALYSRAVDAPNGRAMAQYIRACCESATVPVSFMLDHGSSVENCMKALIFGCTDVMYDGSSLPMDENIANTKKVVAVAHSVGACVEAELGHVGQGNEYQQVGERRDAYTKPDDVERFVEETGVDFLAIAIGTAHGVYDGIPELDLERLAEIRARVDIPLVLHGGSGLSDEQFKSAIAGGIAKVNIFTNLGLAATAGMIAAAGGEKPSYFGITGAARDAVQKEASHFLDVFGASGNA